MKIVHALALTGLVSAAIAPAAYADVRLSIDKGHVSLVAKDATLRQILTEWEKVGQTKIVNLERVPGGPMTLELQNMPEDQALDLLLRPVSGYLAAPRAQAIDNASRFDRIVVMPTPAAPARAMAAAPAPAVNAPLRMTDDDRDDDQPAPNVMPTPNPRGPVFNSFPQPRVVNPSQQPSAVPGAYPPQQQDEPGGEPSAAPGTPAMPPGTVSTPGMIAPTPQAPGQPGAPVRRPGGPGGPGGL